MAHPVLAACLLMNIVLGSLAGKLANGRDPASAMMGCFLFAFVLGFDLVALLVWIAFTVRG